MGFKERTLNEIELSEYWGICEEDCSENNLVIKVNAPKREVWGVEVSNGFIKVYKPKKDKFVIGYSSQKNVFRSEIHEKKYSDFSNMIKGLKKLLENEYYFKSGG